METAEAAPSNQSRLFPSGRRTRMWVAGCVLVASALIFWRAANVFLLLFLCVLLALFLRGVSDWSTRHLRVPGKWSLTITVLVLLALFSGIGWLLAPEISEQVGKLREELPRAVRQIQEHISHYSWGRQLTETVQGMANKPQNPGMLPKAAGVLSSTFNVVGALVVLVFVGVYLAADPKRYVNGVVHLLPPGRRQRAQELFSALGTTLQRWLIGRLLLMTTNGIVTSLGLWLMHVPLALSLGIFSALLNFIPNFGPIIAAIPAVLIAFLQGPDQALYVAIFYVVYQNIDGYVFTPMVQKRTVALPPALTILAQVLLGVLLGTLGVLLAVPLAAAGLVAIKMLYIEDVFGEPISTPANES